MNSIACAHFYCCVCGKPLTDPVSVAFGIGPICRINQKLQEAHCMNRNLFGSKADFSYEIVAGVVCIVDNDRGMSVTNAVDAVLAEIAAVGIDVGQHRVIYRDTLRVWDEIVVDQAGHFVSFKSLNERERCAALAKLQTAP